MKSPDTCSTCSTCGSPLPRGAAQRRCPACFLKAGMDAETIPSGAANIPDSMEGAVATTTPLPPEALGTLIGRYKLLQEIGEGRYEAERQALALMDHPISRRSMTAALRRTGALTLSWNW